MEITQPPAKSPQPRPHRRTTQIKRNTVVVAWIFTALVLLAGKYAQLWPNLDAWAPLHAALLGALGSAITIGAPILPTPSYTGPPGVGR